MAERAKRKSAAEKSSVTPAPVDKKRKPLHEYTKVPYKATARLFYRTQESTRDYMDELRWYYVGSIPLAFVQIYKKGESSKGRYVVYINLHFSKEGNGFDNEGDMHSFLTDQIEGRPLD